MSIIIKGLSLPERGCLNVQIWPDGRVNELRGGIEWTAMELPDHGDLVDIDEVMKTASEMDIYWETECELPMILRNAPVLIPAERSEE